MKTGLSVILPGPNEEAYLPGLLDALRRQILTPLENIIVDVGASAFLTPKISFLGKSCTTAAQVLDS